MRCTVWLALYIATKCGRWSCAARRWELVSPPLPGHVATAQVPEIARFASRWQTVGLASEQAVESSNRVVKRLDRSYTTIRAKDKRMSALIKQLVLEHN